MLNTSIKEAAMEMAHLCALPSDSHVKVAAIQENTGRYEGSLVRADPVLYRAKLNGRNQVKCGSAQECLK